MSLPLVAISLTAFLTFTLPATAAPPAAGTDKGPPAPGTTLTRTIYGRYLVRSAAHPDGSATAHFSPGLPLADHRLITRAMWSLARVAYHQDDLDVNEQEVITPVIGSPIVRKLPEYEYRFVLDGTLTKGIDTIAVNRSVLPPPVDVTLSPRDPNQLPPAAGASAPR